MKSGYSSAPMLNASGGRTCFGGLGGREGVVELVLRRRRRDQVKGEGPYHRVFPNSGQSLDAVLTVRHYTLKFRLQVSVFNENIREEMPHAKRSPPREHE